MKVNKITVTAGRTFSHPYEQYSNLRPEVTMEATIDDGESAADATRHLQSQAEGLVEDHKNSLLKSIEELHRLTETQSELRGLQRQLEAAQSRINDIRTENPTLQLTSGE